MTNLYLLQKITLEQRDESQVITELSGNMGKKFTVGSGIHDIVDDPIGLENYLLALDNVFPRFPMGVILTTSGNDLVIDIGELYYVESYTIPSLSGHLDDKLQD